jgi:pimeloyl-ACP methyl ester carboxylesterase
VAPFSESASVMRALPRGTLIAIDSAGHMSHADQPAVATGAIAAFLHRLPD